MKKKTWIRAVLAHEPGVPVPYNLSLSPPARQRLAQHYGPGDVEDLLDLPLRMRGLGTVKPLYASPEAFGPTARDEFGVVWTTSEVDRGAPIGPPLVAPDLSAYAFPDPAAPHRVEGLEAWAARHADAYTVLWVGDLWERATFLCGMENLLLWTALEPAFVEALLVELTDYLLRTLALLIERVPFDGIALSDDYGTQRGMVMSPEAWRRLVKPRLALLFAGAKVAGKTIFLHSCGDIRPIVPDLVGLGLDILHPIQPEAMDIAELKREFGRDLTFCGGLGTQELLVRATPEAIREEVRRLKREMGHGGGYILETGITVQADVPLANLVAMIEAARE